MLCTNDVDAEKVIDSKQPKRGNVIMIDFKTVKETVSLKRKGVLRMTALQKFLKRKIGDSSTTPETYFVCRMLLNATNEASRDALKDLKAGRLLDIFAERRMQILEYKRISPRSTSCISLLRLLRTFKRL